MKINGDKKLSLINSAIYTLFFFIEFLYEKKSKKDYIFDILIQDLNKFWNDDNLINYSPARIATDSFLINYLKKNFDIKKKLNVIDLGCGFGNYSNYLRNFGYEVEYTGIDWNPKTEKILSGHKKNNFILADFDNENKGLFEQLNQLNQNNKFNLILSHSFFEHIQKDITIFNALKENFNDVNQIHFVPASISFFNYFRHGYRRYNFKTNQKLSNQLDNFYKIYNLGNHESLIQYYVRYYLFYGKKHKLDFFNLYKKNKDIFLNIKKYIYSNTNQYPVFYCFYK
tara:strand:- start:235 stop:1086 length:852 start_codon:yes stop_codon:yes gene_type:complete